MTNINRLFKVKGQPFFPWAGTEFIWADMSPVMKLRLKHT